MRACSLRLYACAVPHYVDVDELIDAQAVAELLGLTQRNTVSAYLHR